MDAVTRRQFLTTTAGGMAAVAFGATRLKAAAASARIQVGCQANGFPLKPGDFPALLAALRQMKALGYEGFECNIRLVEGEFARMAEARKAIEDTSVKFIGVHTSMQLAKPDVFPHWVECVAALGASCIVMSNAGPAEAKNTDADAWRQKAAALEELGKTCRRGGLRLAYHNHNPEFAN